jgi:VRR-NUC domain protein
MSEAQEQIALIQWANLQSGRYPELALLYHIPNGGSRHPAEAARLKQQGVRAGVPDLCLPVARGGYNGLYIELKAGRNKPTPLQKEWLSWLNQQGYRAVVCWGWQAAKDEIMAYLEEGQYVRNMELQG